MRTILVLTAVTHALACTYFEVRSPVRDVPFVVANTNEWYLPDSGKDYRAVLHPRGEQHQAKCHGGSGWQAKLGIVAMESDDGNMENSLNEVGLSISVHALRGVDTYRPANTTATFCASDLAVWIATTFEKVADVRSALTSVAVLSSGSGSPSCRGSCRQYAIADAAGESIVVDYFGGALHLHDNRGVGVLTNDPEYAWHLRNLNNYVGLQMSWPDNNANATCDSEVGRVPVAVGHGQNLLGLPGDLSPPSRFVRTFFMRNYAVRGNPPASLDEALVLASGLLNTQHIVKGFNAKLPNESGYDFTVYSTLVVPASRLLFYRTYEESQWRRVNLSTLDFSRAGSTRKSTGAFGAIDVTDQIQPARLSV